MNIRQLSFVFVISTLALNLLACATPGPIKSLAEQGAATVGLAEASLREYAGLLNSQTEARMDLLRYEAEQLAKDRAAHRFDLMLDDQAGVTHQDAAAKLIQSLGEERRKLRELEATELEKIATDTILAPDSLMRIPTDKLSTARKSFTVLAQELSPKDWVQLYVTYAKEIQRGVDQLKDATTPSP